MAGGECRRRGTVMSTIKIANREIGEGQPAFVIAEIGTNHNRRIETAKELIRACAEAKVDAVKFQIYEADDIVSRSIRPSDYGLEKMFPAGTMHEVFDQKLRTPREWFPDLTDYAREQGVLVLATAHSRSAAEFIMKQNMCAIKIASMDMNNLPVLDDIAQVAKVPVIFSTGLSELDEIQETVNVFKTRNVPFSILHCVASYPAAFEDLHLKNMEHLRNLYRVPVGFSDHTLSGLSSAVAVALGASIIEKHVTLNRKDAGPDHPFAIEPNELKQLMIDIRNVEKACQANAGFTGPSERERVKRTSYRRSLVASVDIPEGARISRVQVKITRPGTGIAPKYLSQVIGRPTRRAISAETPIEWDMV
jgi:sialic acid synthase SpsE